MTIFWDNLKPHKDAGRDLYEFIVNFLGARCFTSSIAASIKAYLLQVMPSFDGLLRNQMEKKDLRKYILESASRVGVIFRADSEECMIFEASCVVLAYLNNPIIAGSIITEFDVLLEKYPSFRNEKDIDQKELTNLLLYHNMMVSTLFIMHARFNKKHVMDLVCRLTEGNLKKYTCGGGQSCAVDRRVLIYESVGELLLCIYLFWYIKILYGPRWDNQEAPGPAVERNSRDSIGGN